jgi:transcriptional regulator with XRE-family HTH domain
MNDHDGFYTQVGARIRQKRRQLGLSQEGLAKAVGLKRPSMSNIESGRQNILLHTFYDIAETLGTDANSLLPDRPMPGTPAIPDLASYSEGVRGFVEAAIKSGDREGR